MMDSSMFVWAELGIELDLEQIKNQLLLVEMKKESTCKKCKKTVESTCKKCRHPTSRKPIIIP